jgi:primosomal protein N' (replication factor Y)
MLTINLNQDNSKINKYLSNTLLKKINENLENNNKIILYLNKRWDYSALICDSCQHIYKCDNCDVSLNHSILLPYK